jgi:hypothetical protein
VNQNFLNHINKYHPIEWLLKSVELSRRDNSKFKSKLDISSSSEFLVIMSDVAIRVSQKNIYNGDIPTDKEYEDFIHLYINTQDSNHTKLLQDHGVIALSLICTEQMKFHYPIVNLIGRLSLLYSHYEDEILGMAGLRITHILTILIALMAHYQKPENYIFEARNINVKGLTKENINSFLNFFSSDVKAYKNELKNLGFDKRKLYSFRLLEKKPIINFNKEYYILPSIDNLLYSITSGMNIHLLTYFSNIGKGKKYHDLLGGKFEDYVRLLTCEVFDDIIEAKDIVPKETENAEFVIDFDNTAIVVEVKKFVLLRDSAFKTDINDLDTLIKRHIVKAYKQIKTTFKYVKQGKKIGIIVTLGDINIQTSIFDYLRSKYPNEGAEYLDNIIIMSIGQYEALFANTPEDIMTILNTSLYANSNYKTDILLAIHSLGKETKNKFLLKAYSAEIDEIKKIIR